MNLNAILEALIREFGRDILRERGRVLGLVADRHPDAKREQRLLKVAYEAGVVEDLRRDGGEYTQRRVLRRLTEEFVIEPDAALFTVEALCAVLGHPRSDVAAPAGGAPTPTASHTSPVSASALPPVENIHGWPAAKVQALQQQTAAIGRPVKFRDRLKTGVEALCAVLGHPRAGLTMPAGSAPPPAAHRGNFSPPALPPVENIHGWPAAKVQALQQQTAAALGRPVVFRDRLKSGGKGPEMAVIPAGRFAMGSPDSEPGRYDSEGPQHHVTIARPFALGKYAVTFDDYDRYCTASGKAKPADQGWGRGRRPVINVSWKDARAYCAWLSGETGKNYRLPSEAEWEYACRAGSITPFWWGDTLGTGQANYNGDHAYNGSMTGEYRKRTLAVDAFKANPFGLYQMHGNVWEWCEDAWHDNYQGAPADGGPWLDTNPMAGRVVRGGFWGGNSRWLRSANRSGVNPGNRIYLGVRVAQD